MTVLAAIDLSETSSRRVLHHAAGFARLLRLPLRVMHVASDCSAASRQQVIDCCAQLGPYEVVVDEEDIVVRSGLVSEAIHREAAKLKASLIVMGSRGHSRIAAVLLGSTCQAVLRNAAAPPHADDHMTGTMLRERAHGADPVKPYAMIVRHGNIAEEISRCALAEGAGLVVMGLRPRGRGTPGAIAAAVLRSNRAFVLAVPAA